MSLEVPEVPEDAWVFEFGEKGRPELAERLKVRYPQTVGLRFNLSHTQNLFAVIVTDKLDCGVDVETSTRSTDMVSVGRRSFTDNEFRSFAALSQVQQRQRFFELWTLKESYIKAIGTGLSTSLKAFSFAPDVEPIAIEFSSTIKDSPQRWRLGLRKPDLDHQLGWAVAVEGHDATLEVAIRWYRSLLGTT